MKIFNRLFMFVLLVTVSLSAANWKFDEIYKGKASGVPGERFTINSNGKLYIFYGKYHLYALENDGTGWSNQYVIDDSDGVGDFVSSTQDSAGNIYLVYRNRITQALKYATNKSGSWVSTTVRATDTAWAKSSIVVDSSGTVHIFFLYGSTIYHTYDVQGVWQVEQIATGATNLSADIDDDFKVIHLMYLNSAKTELYYGYKDTTTQSNWTTKKKIVLISDTINELAFDVTGAGNSGVKAVAFYRSNGDVALMKIAIDADMSSDAIWSMYIIDSSSLDESSQLAISVGSTQSIWVSYYNKEEAMSKFAYYDSGTDSFNVVSDTENLSWGYSLSFLGFVASSIYIHANHSFSEIVEVRVTQDAVSRVVIAKIPKINSNITADLAVNAVDNLYTVFYTMDGVVKYGAKVGSSWQIEDVTTATDIASNPAITVKKSSNFPDILYSSGNELILKHLTYGGWVDGNDQNGVVADSAGSISSNGFKSPKMAYDSNDNLHIIYIENATSTLYYLAKIDGIWGIATEIDTSINDYCSLDIDSNNHVHIAYEKKDVNLNTDIYHASNETGLWKIKNVDATNVNQSKKYPVVKVDSQDLIHIAFYEGKSNEIRYTKSSVLYEGNRYWSPIKSKVILSNPSLISMLIDKNNGAEIFYSLSGDGLGHVKVKDNELEFENRLIGYDIDGTSAVRVKNGIVILATDEETSSIVEGFAANADISPSVIMYLLN